MAIALLQRTKLTPVVELEPARFGTAPSPPGPWSSEQSLSYWRACLDQSGLGGLSPIGPGSWHVRLTELLDDSVLQIILRAHLKEQPSDDPDVPPLSGGFALCEDSEPIFLPQCCSDLADLEQWSVACAHASSEAAMLWCGHPWLEVEFQDPSLLLRETSEYPKAKWVPRSVLVKQSDLLRAVVDARAQLTDLVSHVARALADIGVPSPRRVAASVLGLVEQGAAG